jgi:hypothetical protein
MSTRKLPAGKNIRTQPYSRPSNNQQIKRTPQHDDGYTRTYPPQPRTPAKYENLSYRKVQQDSEDDSESEQEMPQQQKRKMNTTPSKSGPIAWCKKCGEKVQMINVERVPMYYKKDAKPNKKGEVAYHEGDYMKDRFAGTCPNCESNLSAFIGKEDN